MKVDSLLAEVLQRPFTSLPTSTALKDIPDWDSIMMVRLMLRLEENAGRELSEAELEAIATIGDVERLLR